MTTTNVLGVLFIRLMHCNYEYFKLFVGLSVIREHFYVKLYKHRHLIFFIHYRTDVHTHNNFGHGHLT